MCRSALIRRQPKQIWKSIVDIWIFAPELWIEPCGQSGLQLLTCEARETVAALGVPASLGSSARVNIPVIVSAVIIAADTHKSPDLRTCSAADRPKRIGCRDRAPLSGKAADATVRPTLRGSDGV